MTPRDRSRRRPQSVMLLLAMLPAALLAPVHACRTSPDPRLAARNDSRMGAIIVVRLLDGRRHVGELLAVEDSSLIVLSGDRIAIARSSDVVGVEAPTSSSRALPRGVWASSADQRRARLASRFPYGIADPAMRALLARLGQSAPDTLAAGPR